ncbi:MAG TPA: glycerol-3-phosphate dehydrogenase subunit GlpB [Desulfomicrobiaceae bacterium]|nr:glycerol-3-phosphate dehydrogenase subunit GlpB [Desulfomicrobiaceae bacterium]
MSREIHSCDLMVIGSGFAGMAAALFAAQNGLKTAQAGSTGGIDFSTGFIDLMAVHPVSEGTVWDNPFEAIRAVSRDCPDHPYARLSEDEIRTGLDAFISFLGSHDIPYTGDPDANVRIVTSAGTVKPTWRVPASAWNGVLALREKAPTLLVDFHGLKGFSAAQIRENCAPVWPGLKSVRLPFPASRGELYPEHMAWAVSDPRNQEALAASVAGHDTDAEYIGFPGVLGLLAPMRVVKRLEEMTGKKIFEIPTMPPCIAGSRLRGAFDRGFPDLAVTTFTQKMVRQAVRLKNGIFEFTVGTGHGATTVRAKNAILASGRFFGKGLTADRQRIRETVFDLPVTQPENRTLWHREHFLDPRGHAVNSAGLSVDESFRPVDENGIPMYNNLYAAGAILAGQDWMRMKCGAGLAIATAYRAVQEIVSKN